MREFAVCAAVICRSMILSASHRQPKKNPFFALTITDVSMVPMRCSNWTISANSIGRNVETSKRRNIIDKSHYTM